MLELGIQSKGIINENVIELGYSKIAYSGIACVDYNITIPVSGNDLDVSYYVKHKTAASKYGLNFSQVHAPLIKPDEEKVEAFAYMLQEMKKSIEICHLLESPYLVIHVFNLSSQMNMQEEKEFNLNFFKDLSYTAIKHGITICIENMPCRKNGRLMEGFCSNSYDLVEFIKLLNKEAGTDCFAACFDTGHANVFGKNLREEIKIYGKYLKVLHIHDNDGHTDSHQLPYSFSSDKTGECTTDWSGFLLGLREINYSGVLSFETYRSFTGMPGVLQDAMLKFLYSIGTNFSRVICFEEKLKGMESKKKILFGAGKMFDVYMKEFGSKYPPVFAVDNNSELWGTSKRDILIHNPQDILSIPEDERLVIICNAFYEEIIDQLEKMGISEYILTEEILRMNGKPI